MTLKRVMGALLLCLLGADSQAQMTIQQSLEVREPGSMSFSPDGAQLAYVVKQAVLSSDSYRHTLQIGLTRGGAPRTLATAESIGSVQWTSDGKGLVYLAKTGEVFQAWMVRLDGTPPRQLTHHSSGVGAGLDVDLVQRLNLFRLSPDGKRGLYFTRDKIAAEEQLETSAAGNFVYTDNHSYFEVTGSRYGWMKMPAAAMTLRIVDMDSGKEREVWRSPAPGQDMAYIPIEFAWSPDGRFVALAAADKRHPTLNRHPFWLLSGDTFAAQTALPNLGHALDLTWNPDSRSIEFYSYGEVTEHTKVLYDYHWYRYSLLDKTLSRIDKESSAKGVLQDRIRAATQDEVSTCVYNTKRTEVACVRASPAAPPEVALYALTGNGVKGPGRVLTHLNPELDNVKIGQVQPIRGREEDGIDSGLILPVDYVPGKQYPLVVMLYNLYHKERFTGALSFTSYPAQVFAANGYMVILQNPPTNTHVYPEGDFETARAHEADGVTASLRAMLDQLIARNMIDPKRLGIMGWSWGGFYTPYIATHHPDWFAVAAMGEGGNHQPTGYWLNDASWRRQEDRYYGKGGPYGPHADRWKSVAPLYNVDKLRAPIMMEYSMGLLVGLELHRAILDAGKISEFYVYPKELHVFERPSNRFDSMQRHFDWFHFWLSNQENPDPRRKEQNERWRKLR